MRLKRLAQLRARLLPGLEWDELLNEALLRALDGSRRWPEGVSLLSFIAGIMRSLLDGRAQQRRRLAERALTARETSVTAAPDARLHARQCPATIAQFFVGYAGVLALIAAFARRYLGGAGDPAPQLSRKRREAGTHAKSDRAGLADPALPRPAGTPSAGLARVSRSRRPTGLIEPRSRWSRIV